VTPGGKRFVVDASVAIKWIVDEADSDRADLLQGTDMVAPRHLPHRGAMLRTIAGRQALSEGRAMGLSLRTAPVVIVDHDELPERRALEPALRHAIHDCIHFAPAERSDRRLVTIDRRSHAASRPQRRSPRRGRPPMPWAP